MEVNRCGVEASVPKEDLERLEVDAALEKMRGEAVAKRVGCDAFFDPGADFPPPTFSMS